MPRVNFSIPAELLDQIDSAKPDYLDRKSFICLLLTQQLTGGANLPAYRVGAGTSGNGESQPECPKLEQAPTRAVDDQCIASFEIPATYLGDGVGRECEGGPRKDPKQVCGNLLAHEELIRDFWRVKGGSKGERAWSLLLTELTKIQDAHGDAVLRQQLELAINGKWKGITLANLERFAPTKKSARTSSGFNYAMFQELDRLQGNS